MYFIDWGELYHRGLQVLGQIDGEQTIPEQDGKAMEDQAFPACQGFLRMQIMGHRISASGEVEQSPFAFCAVTDPACLPDPSHQLFPTASGAFLLAWRMSGTLLLGAHSIRKVLYEICFRAANDRC